MGEESCGSGVSPEVGLYPRVLHWIVAAPARGLSFREKITRPDRYRGSGLLGFDESAYLWAEVARAPPPRKNLPHMRINSPNLAYAIAHPVRAIRYLLHRDKIPYHRIARYLPENPVIVEAGAHDGATTVEMARFWPLAAIHAFEPIPSAAAEVRRKIDKFGSRIQCHQLALGEREAVVFMHVSGDGSAGSCQSSSILAPTTAQTREFPSIQFRNTERVTAVPLDSWAEANGLTQVDFMWLGMQGYELAALAGARQLL